MNRIGIIVPILLGLTLVMPAAAQEEPATRVEIGVRGGVAAFENESNWIRVWSMPGAGMPLVANAYGTFFLDGGNAVEPYVAFSRTAASEGHSSQIAIGGQVMRFTDPNPEASSGYGFVTGGMLGTWSTGSSSAAYQLGGGVGYRTMLQESLAVRFELRYRRWFDDSPYGLNEVSVGVGLGALLGTP